MQERPSRSQCQYKTALQSQNPGNILPLKSNKYDVYHKSQGKTQFKNGN